MHFKDNFLNLIKDGDFSNLEKRMGTQEISLWRIINRLKRDENSYSDFLAYFLNPSENHGIEDRFLKKLIFSVVKNENELVGNSKTALHPIDIEMSNFYDVNVYREYNFNEYGRIDILIEDQGNEFLILIENKLYSKEGKNQTNRYWEAINQKFDASKYPDKNRLLIFLSPDGLNAENENFINISYQVLIDTVNELIKENNMPIETKRILANYMKNLKEITMDNEKIKLAEQIYAKYAELIDFIYRVGNDQFETPDSDWNGEDYYYNIGENFHRNWDDYIKYSFIAAGGGRKYIEPLKRLRPGNRVFAYYKSKGYLGIAIIKDEAIPAKDFIAELEKEKISILAFKEPGINHDLDDLEKCEWIVKVQWTKYIANRDDAIFFTGIFANQNIVCKLKNKHLKTIQTVEKKLEI